MSHSPLRHGPAGTRAPAPFGAYAGAPPGGAPLTGLAVDELRARVREHRLLVLRGFTVPEDAGALAAWCARWGAVMRWPFGDVLELVEAAEPTDHIFDHSSVPLHWDGMYKPLVPEFQVFHCVSAPGAGNGGRTTFCDTVRLLREAGAGVVERWRRVRVTYRIRSVVHYGGRAVSPLVVPHPRTGEPTLRFNQPPPGDEPGFLNRPDHTFEGVAAEEVPALLAELDEALHDPRYFRAHDWRTGDVVIADNYALLHGRERFTSRAPRHLRRVHLLGDPPFANPAVA
jgi:alpha-ketoglutarate-dependent taurine dioxygenase